MKTKLGRIAALGLGIFFSTAANAELREYGYAIGQDRTSPFMQEYGRALPPIGHIGFCRRHPGECSALEIFSTRFELTPERRREMVEVNRLVNELIKPVTDQELYGRLEHWTYPAASGDCEDYVLLKRRLLMERGWPSSALLITVVRDENNDGHAILTARTAEGDYILDNKRNEIFAWNQSGYAFVKRQSHWNPQLWISLAAPAPRDMRNLSLLRRR